jgi:hypothetical protein
VFSLRPSCVCRLGWSLTAITPMHFLGLFHQQGLLFQGDTMGRRPVSMRLVRYMQKYTDFFADLTLQEYDFNQYRPSLLAAAIVCAARKALAIKWVPHTNTSTPRTSLPPPVPNRCVFPCCRPMWNPELQSLLHCDWTDISSMVDHIWQYYAVSFPVEVSEHARQERELEAEAASTTATAPLTVCEVTPQAASSTMARTAGGGVSAIVQATVTPPEAENGASARLFKPVVDSSPSSSPQGLSVRLD